jgi:hypothetical protein
MDDETGKLIEEPKLFVHPNCPETIREFTNYKSPSPTRGRNPKAPREVGLAIDDHAMDAIRYGLMHIFKLGLHGPLFADSDRMAMVTQTPKIIVASNQDSLPIYASVPSEETFVNMNMEF